MLFVFIHNKNCFQFLKEREQAEKRALSLWKHYIVFYWNAAEEKINQHFY